MTVVALTRETFDEQLASAERPVLVDVWNEWCPPCKALEPVLDALATENADRLEVFKVNAEEHPDIVPRFDVMAFPTLLIFKDGELVHRLVGARGKHHLLEELEPFLEPFLTPRG